MDLYNKQILKYIEEMSGEKSYFCSWEGDIHPYKREIDGYDKAIGDIYNFLSKNLNVK